MQNHPISFWPSSISLKDLIDKPIQNITFKFNEVKDLIKLKNLIFRRSIYVSKLILKGEKFSDLNMTTKRSKSGINSRDWDLVCSKEASKDFQAGDLIEIE